MKTKNIKNTEKPFVEQMREIRDKISLEIKDMTMDQLKQYLKSKKTLLHSNVWKMQD